MMFVQNKTTPILVMCSPYLKFYALWKHAWISADKHKAISSILVRKNKSAAVLAYVDPIGCLSWICIPHLFTKAKRIYYYINYILYNGTGNEHTCKLYKYILHEVITVYFLHLLPHKKNRLSYHQTAVSK